VNLFGSIQKSWFKNLLDIRLVSHFATPKEKIDVQSSGASGLSRFKEFYIVLKGRQANALKGYGVRTDP
jgi:hypothetical protein